MMEPRGQWSAARADDWYARQPWRIGCNFIPSTAVNQLEMWQADTFDAETIDRELGWAATLGLNSMRVFLHDLLWHDDPAGFVQRIESYLTVSARHGISTMFVLFDDCWHDNARLGPQPQPVPGRHNSRWLQSPGHRVVADPAQYPRLEAYVMGVVGAFGADERVIVWDLYNELTNGFLPESSLPEPERTAAMTRAAALRVERMPPHLRLLDLVFTWARETRPLQPLTAGVFLPDRELNAHLIETSDIVTFHHYGDARSLETLINRLRRHGRPLICTEWMARGSGSRIETHLPIFERERIGCYNWSLVNGKTQTQFSWTDHDTEDPDIWFHDLLRGDGKPYDEGEAQTIRRITGVDGGVIDG